MGDLYLTLLGPPEVRHGDQVLLFSTRKELALLIYLTVEGGVHSRKKLSEQFWPEGDARHGRAVVLRPGDSTGAARGGMAGCRSER